MKAISILACGADPTAQRLSTSAIQQAINSAQQNDVIVIPQGRFLTGALFLKSGVSLRLDAGAQLVGSRDLADYPLINTRVAGIDMRWPAGIINIIDCENVSITGTGTIDGQGVIWWQRFWGDDERSGMVGDYSARGLRWVIDYDCQRPRNIWSLKARTFCCVILPVGSPDSGTYTSVIRAVSRLRVCKSAILRGRAPTGLTSTPANRCGLNAALCPAMTTIFASNLDEDAKRRKSTYRAGYSDSRMYAE